MTEGVSDAQCEPGETIRNSALLFRWTDTCPHPTDSIASKLAQHHRHVLSIKLVGRKRQCMPIVDCIVWRRFASVQSGKERCYEFGRRPSKDVQRLGGQCRILLSSVEPCTSARRQIEAEKRLAGCCPHVNPRLQSSAERGFNGTEFAIHADVEVAVTAAAQSVEGDMRNSISPELQLNQVQVVPSDRLFGPGMRAQIESGSASKK